MTNSHLKCFLVTFACVVNSSNLVAQSPMLAVVNTAGEVWTRYLSFSDGTIGPGFKLDGPPLFGGPDAQFVVGGNQHIAVITNSGAFWQRNIAYYNRIEEGIQAAGSLFGGTDTSFVLFDDRCRNVHVVNNRGEIWTHYIQQGSDLTVSPGQKISGPSLFYGSNARYVLLENSRVLVVNTLGEVWAHDLVRPPDYGFFNSCRIDAVGPGYKLNGPSLFGANDDRYAAWINGYLLVVNTAGEVWARAVNQWSVGDGFKLDGPGLFWANNDAFVVTHWEALRPPR
jgi:hypothetical protein